MTTVLINNRVLTARGARVAGGDLWLPRAEFERIASHLPAPRERREAESTDAEVNVCRRWRAAGRPAHGDAAGEIWVLGASARERADALRSLEAPDFTLPDLDGQAHSLSDLRGSKVFLASWSSW